MFLISTDEFYKYTSVTETDHVVFPLCAGHSITMPSPRKPILSSYWYVFDGGAKSRE